MIIVQGQAQEQQWQSNTILYLTISSCPTIRTNSPQKQVFSLEMCVFMSLKESLLDTSCTQLELKWG